MRPERFASLTTSFTSPNHFLFFLFFFHQSPFHQSLHQSPLSIPFFIFSFLCLTVGHWASSQLYANKCTRVVDAPQRDGIFARLCRSISWLRCRFNFTKRFFSPRFQGDVKQVRQWLCWNHGIYFWVKKVGNSKVQAVKLSWLRMRESVEVTGLIAAVSGCAFMNL